MEVCRGSDAGLWAVEVVPAVACAQQCGGCDVRRRLEHRYGNVQIELVSVNGVWLIVVVLSSGLEL